MKWFVYDIVFPQMLTLLGENNMENIVKVLLKHWKQKIMTVDSWTLVGDHFVSNPRLSLQFLVD